MGYWGLGDAATVQAQIAAAAAQYGVDPNLALAVAKQESGYQQYGSGGGVLTSSAGALGVMQLMPATAAGLGVDPTNQQQNINGGVKLLSQLLNQFNGNVPLALAAYNAGPGAVQQYGGIPPYAQTQNYVASIMANYQPGGYSAPSDTSPDTSPSPLNWLQSLSLPDSLTQDASYTLPGGLVLSGSDLLLLGGALVLGLVISAML